MRILILLLAGLAFAGCVSKPNEPSGVSHTLREGLDGAAARIKADISWLADDARAGRRPGTQGYVDASNYVATRMKESGLAPKGRLWTWRQDVVLKDVQIGEVDPSAAFVGEKTVKLEFGKDFLVAPSFRTLDVAFDAPVVFVGFGVSAAPFDHDDYDGVEIAGKVVAFLEGAPASLSDEAQRFYGSLENKQKAAAQRGAIAAISLSANRGELFAETSADLDYARRLSTALIAPPALGAENDKPIPAAAIVLNAESSAALFDKALYSFSDLVNAAPGQMPEAFDLDTRLRFAGSFIDQDFTGANVIGIRQGGNRFFNNEYIVVTAHLDHLGAFEASEGVDGVYNGALDNASGVAIILEAARILSERDRLTRDVVFVALTAEELGLRGSQYFLDSEHLPTEKIVANINIDMPVLLHDLIDVAVIGGERSTLGDLATDAIARAGLRLSEKPFPLKGVIRRSDQMRFIEKGIPAVYLAPGFDFAGEVDLRQFLKVHYHQVTDEVDLPIRYDSAAQLALVTANFIELIANAPTRPEWHSGDEFGDAYGVVD